MQEVPGEIVEVLSERLKDVAPNMCVDCQRRAEVNPLRVLDCKVPEDQPIIDSLPSILDYLDEPCRDHFSPRTRVSGRTSDSVRDQATVGARARLLYADNI